MSEQIREQISAFLDGELPTAEQRLLLERMARDPALRTQWSRYQLISDSLRKALPPSIDLGLADRVMAELESVPEHHGAARTSLLRAVKPLAGLAVAASVAVVAVLAVQQTRAPEPGTVQVATNPMANPMANLAVMPGPEAYSRVQDTQWTSQGEVQPPQVRSQLNEYLVNHSEYAASGGMPGMLPYVRVVGYDQE